MRPPSERELMYMTTARTSAILTTSAIAASNGLIHGIDNFLVAPS